MHNAHATRAANSPDFNDAQANALLANQHFPMAQPEDLAAFLLYCQAELLASFSKWLGKVMGVSHG